MALGLEDRPPASAGRGRQTHVRGANRHTDEGVETVTLVTHAGRPLASR